MGVMGGFVSATEEVQKTDQNKFVAFINHLEITPTLGVQNYYFCNW